MMEEYFMEEQMNKRLLLDKIRSRQIDFEQVITPLSEEQLTMPGVNGDWSIKDVLAHLVSWQKRTIDRLDAAAQNKEPTTPPVANDEEVNNLNQRFYEENKERSLSEVLADFKTTYLRMLETVEAMREEDLFDAQKFPWNGGTPLWENVAGNTYEHIDEHIGAIQKWLASYKEQ